PATFATWTVQGPRPKNSMCRKCKDPKSRESDFTKQSQEVLCFQIHGLAICATKGIQPQVLTMTRRCNRPQRAWRCNTSRSYFEPAKGPDPTDWARSPEERLDCRNAPAGG